MADHRQVSRQYKHRRGQAVTHLGRRRHGADDISEGHRVNLIMWNYNSAYRASKSYATQWYEVEARSPDPRCVSYTHDRDWEALTGEPRPEAKFARTAWCPPPPHAAADATTRHVWQRDRWTAQQAACG